MKQTRRILMLEDDYMSMVDLKEHLEEEKGWQVDLTADAGLLERLPKVKYDLILLDLMIKPQSEYGEGGLVNNIQFPDVEWHFTGLEFLKLLRAGEFSQENEGTSPDVPVIVLSAVANDTAAVEADLEKLATRYVEKPFRMSALQAIIDKLLPGE